MCMILDSNMFGEFLKPKNEDMKPIYQWLNTKNGKIIYSNIPQLETEIQKSEKMIKKFQSLKESNQAKLIDKKDVNKSIKKIQRKFSLQSNDSHIIALADASQTKLLCSKDKKLHEDFTSIIKGNIYQKASHKHLLTNDICPP